LEEPVSAKGVGEQTRITTGGAEGWQAIKAHAL